MEIEVLQFAPYDDAYLDHVEFLRKMYDNLIKSCGIPQHLVHPESLEECSRSLFKLTDTDSMDFITEISNDGS